MKEKTVKEWIDSLKFVHKIDDLIERNIESLALGERNLEEEEIKYLILRREKLTNKEYKRSFKKDYERIKNTTYIEMDYVINSNRIIVR